MGGVLCLCVLSLLVTPTPAGAGGCSASVIELRTLHVEAKTMKKKVSRGERFDVRITVTRPAHEDPLGEGIEFEPPVSVPAADVTVWMTIYVGKWTYFWDIGKTDDEGRATLTLRPPRDSELGWGLAYIYAENWVNQQCPDMKEEGDRVYPNFVKVVP